ncbi:MAG: NAD(P)-binding protein [Actinobacteria bacterium]|nr:NAD(P)-binding protein [Actinomycetota bacterium]MBU1942728.1 NAD(P)-binding protein [Actinomycetota bacterium]MBU2686050.1 NAD(P)-binding protein [Actinomycetota bacterium]
MKDSYDAVVVGAGCSGAVFAAGLAERGFSVLLLDRRRSEELGQDSFDLVETQAFEASGVTPPSPPESRPAIEAMEVVSPDTSTRLSIDSDSFVVVDRRALAARLLRRATDAGAEFRGQVIVTGAEIERGRLVAVSTDRGSYRCTLAVSASGLDRVLCRDLPGGMGIPRRLRATDHMSLYSETREVSGEGGTGAPRSGLFEYHVGRFGGYSWAHRSGDGLFDLGTAVQDITGSPDPREIALGYVRSNTAVGEKVIGRAGGRIPTRRPLNTMVANGLMVVGDAACQAMPIIGRGVGGALLGGRLAADAAAAALRAGDVGSAALWPYNVEYMRTRGTHLAALDCLRLLMQMMPEKEFSWSMARGIIDEQDVAGAMAGRVELPGIQFKLKKTLKGLRGMPLLVRYESMMRQIQKVLELYGQYPKGYEAPDFAEWSQQAEFLFEDVERVARGVRE